MQGILLPDIHQVSYYRKIITGHPSIKLLPDIHQGFHYRTSINKRQFQYLSTQTDGLDD
ncbi:MAG: hypothetical protein ACI81O_002345 [Cyclobacteriaceae bacterium]|jgi:hypothetical protein